MGAQIAPRSVFARKNYFYPDLPKGYQISQYEIPVVQGGSRQLPGSPRSGEPYAKTVRLTRAHLEEDAGKSLHEDFHDMSGIDLNRAGTPLLEIVSEPDMRSSAEAVAYARTLHALVVWLGICDGNMQEGSFRCDANVSVRPAGDDRLGTRVEIKNLNSFRFLQQAIDHEMRRQVELIEDGGQVVQETRLYDPDLRPDAADAFQGRRDGLSLLPGPRSAAAAYSGRMDRAGEAGAAGIARCDANAPCKPVRAGRRRCGRTDRFARARAVFRARRAGRAGRQGSGQLDHRAKCRPR